MSDNANDAAYPLVTPSVHGEYPNVSYGMTKREAFAMAAMQGMLANEGISPVGEAGGVVARAAVRFADALLAELAKEQP